MENLSRTTDNELLSLLDYKDNFDDYTVRDNWVDFVLSNSKNYSGMANIRAAIDIIEMLEIEGIEYFTDNALNLEAILAKRTLADKEAVCQAVSFFSPNGAEFYKNFSEEYRKVMENGTDKEMSELNRRLDSLSERAK